MRGEEKHCRPCPDVFHGERQRNERQEPIQGGFHFVAL